MLEIPGATPLCLLFIMFLWMFVCPLCGRLCPLHHFDPTSYEDDIYVERVEGLGRGKGFRTTVARSVFESDSLEVERAVRKLYSRVLMILSILVNHDFTTLGDIVEQLGVPESSLSQEVLRFLQLDSVAEFLYDADEQVQESAANLRRMAEL